ncbi:MAG TPA: hypothetical protein VHW60_02130 [Caulobacteraceae bacterium]|nr:hypothetical protein [Caulobacteraceae bacterium]
MKMKVVFLMGAAALALTLAACDAGPSATSGKPTAPGAAPSAAGAPSQATATTAGPGSTATASADPRDAPVPVAADGKPIWAANRKHTAQENADYQFGKNGKDFNAPTEADYVHDVHTFVASPPAGVQRLQRSNGDTLLYDPKTNTFAVMTSSGVPRTMFKPRDGAAYWREQLEQQQTARGHGSDSDQG